MLRRVVLVLSVLLLWPFSQAFADEYSDAVKIFKEAGDSAKFFDTSYGYAVFPKVGKGGVGVGGAYGSGRVYQQGKVIGESKMTQASLGLQLGGQEYSMIIFFEDESALKAFTKGDFEFGADASAVAITSSANASTSTQGSSAGAAGGKKDAKIKGSGYTKGMATFTVAKGGLMYEAAVKGQKFSFKASK